MKAAREKNKSFEDKLLEEMKQGDGYGSDGTKEVVQRSGIVLIDGF